MEFTAKQIADILGGTIEGDENAKVSSLSKIEEGIPGSLSFLANPIYTQYIYSSKASVVIINESFTPEKPVLPTLIRVPDAYAAFAHLLKMYSSIKLDKQGISPHAFISETARLGEGVYIGEFVFIGEHVQIGNKTKIYPHCYIGDNVTIGSETTLFPGTKVYSDNVIGHHVTIHAGAVLGADGFGFAPQKDNHYAKVPQTGNVVIEDHVEIGANTTIDRATLGSTIIRKGVKLDNLIMVAHNVEIGENTVIAAQSGIAGSTRVGRNCMIAAQVGIIGHIKIADEVKIAGQSGIGKDIATPGEIVQGSPAFNIAEYRKVYVNFRNLNKLARRVDELERRLNQKEQP
jgi:UDP-3-O-[3-hydroxymyristoyl] glucosamine N-acyltransferase